MANFLLLGLISRSKVKDFSNPPQELLKRRLMSIEYMEASNEILLLHLIEAM